MSRVERELSRVEGYKSRVHLILKKLIFLIFLALNKYKASSPGSSLQYFLALLVFSKCLKSFFSFFFLSSKTRLLFSKQRVKDYSKRKEGRLTFEQKIPV